MDNDITKWYINMTAINGFILGIAFGALIVFVLFVWYLTW